LNFLLDFPMPCFIVVGCSRALSVEVIPNSMVAFNPLGYDVVCKWRCVYWEVGVIQILQTVKPCVLYLVFRNKWQCSCMSDQFSDVLVVPVWNL
jgi:hypothetical protein